MYRTFDKHQSSKNWVEILFDILYAVLHFLFAIMYMYHDAHQGSGQQDDTTVPALLSGESLLICFLTVDNQANLLLT